VSDLKENCCSLHDPGAEKPQNSTELHLKCTAGVRGCTGIPMRLHI